MPIHPPSFSSPSSVLPRSRARRVASWSAAALVILVLGVTMSWQVGPVVDWGMDGDLTPGAWEPRLWLKGTLLSALFLPLLGWPAAVAFAIVLATPAALAAASSRRRCSVCGRVSAPHSGDCARCGPLPPRRPLRAGGRVLKRATLGALAGLFLIVPLVTFLAAGIAWVRLEREEDAFGRRARAAAEAGAARHEELSLHGSLLMWSARHGYYSHRD